MTVQVLQSQTFLVFNSSIEFTRCISSEYVLFYTLLKCRPVKVYKHDSNTRENNTCTLTRIGIQKDQNIMCRVRFFYKTEKTF